MECKISNWLHGDKSYFRLGIYILSLFVLNFIVLSFIFILLFIDKSNKTDPKWYLVKDHFWPKYDFFFVKWSHVLVFCIFWVIGVFVLYYKWLFDLVIVIFFLKILVIWPKYVVLGGILGPYSKNIHTLCKFRHMFFWISGIYRLHYDIYLVLHFNCFYATKKIK